MEFIVRRTSSWRTNEMTDDEILKDIDLPYEFDAKVKRIKLEIADKREERVVVVELNGLEDLVGLRNKVGYELIVTTHMCTDLPEIEIHDDWRE